MEGTLAIRLVLRGPVVGREAALLCERLRTVLDATNADRVDCDCGEVTNPDLGTVEALALLQLTAARRGSALVLRGAPPPLLDLVVLAGLAGILRSGVEVVRQSEHREEAGGVQEEGDAGDPIA
jgi:ABC-type transporter Mla MlaB component